MAAEYRVYLPMVVTFEIECRECGAQHRMRFAIDRDQCMPVYSPPGWQIVSGRLLCPNHYVDVRPALDGAMHG